MAGRMSITVAFHAVALCMRMQGQMVTVRYKTHDGKGGSVRVPLEKKLLTLDFSPHTERKRQKAPGYFHNNLNDYPQKPGASCPALPGNMTVEAALVLPLFLFAMGNLLSLILMFQTFSLQEAKLHQTGRELSMLAYVQEGGEPDIRLVRASPVKAVFKVAAFRTASVVNGCVMHKWNGYDLSQGEAVLGGEREEMVYITKSGSAYHRERECIYLNPSVRLVGKGQAEGMTNSAGRKYTACESCGANSDMVYVTDGGTRYHSTVNCSGLKRTIDCVTLQEAVAAGRHACPKCG